METASTLERLSTAINSKNLKLKETACDLDYILALGMVGNKIPMASELIALHLGGSLTAYKEARRAAIKIVRTLNEKRGWRLKMRDDIVGIADAAMKMYLMPTCPTCNGKKYQLIEGTPTLSDRPCESCRGSGWRKFPIKDGRYISEVVWALSRIEDVAADAIRKKLRG